MAIIATHTIKGIDISVRSLSSTPGYCVVITDGSTVRQEGIWSFERQARDYANREWVRINKGNATVYAS